MDNQVKQPQTQGAIIDRMFELREARKEIARQDKDLKEEFDQLEWRLIQNLDEQESTRGGGKLATAAISESISPNIADWSIVCETAKERDMMHLFQRRLNSAAWQELMQMDGAPFPGTEPFTKRTISLTKAKN